MIMQMTMFANFTSENDSKRLMLQLLYEPSTALSIALNGE